VVDRLDRLGMMLGRATTRIAMSVISIRAHRVSGVARRVDEGDAAPPSATW
jgi:hypothetical protein